MLFLNSISLIKQRTESKGRQSSLRMSGQDLSLMCLCQPTVRTHHMCTQSQLPAYTADSSLAMEPAFLEHIDVDPQTESSCSPLCLTAPLSKLKN